MENPTVCYNKQLIEMLEVMRSRNVTPERLGKILDRKIFDAICNPNANLNNRETVRIALGLDSAPRIFRYTIDYRRPHLLEELIALGRYDYVHPEITPERFPIEGEGIVDFEDRYFCFDFEVDRWWLLEELRCASDTANPWELARIEHVLTHGALFPDEQRKAGCIIGVGSSTTISEWQGNPCLTKNEGRSLDLSFNIHSDYPSGYGFLAVRKAQSS